MSNFQIKINAKEHKVAAVTVYQTDRAVIQRRFPVELKVCSQLEVPQVSWLNLLASNCIGRPKRDINLASPERSRERLSSCRSRNQERLSWPDSLRRRLCPLELRLF